ncbi:MAG: hypothetical protein ACRC62_20440 [Microcoleus sp.]
MNNTYHNLLNNINQSSDDRHRRTLDRAERLATSQQQYAVIGARSGGKQLVSVKGSGLVEVGVLTSAHLPVGSVRSFFSANGTTSGYVDAVGP